MIDRTESIHASIAPGGRAAHGLLPAAAQQERPGRAVALQPAERPVVDVQLHLVGGGRARVADPTALRQFQIRVLDVHHDVVAIPDVEIGSGDSRLLRRQVVGEQSGKDIAAYQQVGQAVGKALGISQSALVDDRYPRGHRIPGLQREIQIPTGDRR